MVDCESRLLRIGVSSVELLQMMIEVFFSRAPIWFEGAHHFFFDHDRIDNDIRLDANRLNRNVTRGEVLSNRQFES